MTAESSKRDQILAAAQKCFVNYGFKKTSMSDIARASNMSRPALYLDFENKEAIFCALVEQLHQSTLSQAETALKQPGKISERIFQAFESRMIALFSLVINSIHGDELTDINSKVASEINRAAMARFTQLLAQTIETAVNQNEIQLTNLDLSPLQAADLLVNSAHGLKEAATSVEDLQTRLQHLLRLFAQATTKS